MLNLLKYNSMSFCGVDVWGDLLYIIVSWRKKW